MYERMDREMDGQTHGQTRPVRKWGHGQGRVGVSLLWAVVAVVPTSPTPSLTPHSL